MLGEVRHTVPTVNPPDRNGFIDVSCFDPSDRRKTPPKVNILLKTKVRMKATNPIEKTFADGDRIGVKLALNRGMLVKEYCEQIFGWNGPGKRGELLICEASGVKSFPRCHILVFDARAAVNPVDGGVSRQDFTIPDEAVGQVIVVGIKECDERESGILDAQVAARSRAVIAMIWVTQKPDLLVASLQVSADRKGIVGPRVIDKQDFPHLGQVYSRLHRSLHRGGRIVDRGDDGDLEH